VKSAVLISTMALLTGCVAQPVKQDLSAFYSAAPRSILVVPTVNKSLDVEAPNFLLSTLSVPLAEKGYYVFPVNTVKFVLEQEGFYEGESIHQQPPGSLAKLFGADAVLYVTINNWDAKYAFLSTVVTVDFDYRMADRNGVGTTSNTSNINRKIVLGEVLLPCCLLQPSMQPLHELLQTICP